MEPNYFVENRYSFVADPRPFLRAVTYEIDTPETAFERSIQRDLAEANQALTEGKHLRALRQYESLRGRILETLRPSPTGGIGTLGTTAWARLDPPQIDTPLLELSAHMLRHTPVTESAVPETFRSAEIELSTAAEATLATLDDDGLQGRDGASNTRAGALVRTANDLASRGKWAEARERFERAHDSTDDDALKAAILHDIAVTEEKSDNREGAIRTAMRSAELFEREERFEEQARALVSLAGMQARGGDPDAAEATIERVGRVDEQHNLSPAVLAASSRLTTRLEPVFGEGGVTLPERPGGVLGVGGGRRFGVGGTTLPGRVRPRPGISRDDEPVVGDDGQGATTVTQPAVEDQPLTLLAPTLVVERQPSRSFSVLDGQLEAHRIDLDENAGENLATFYRTLSETADVELLTGYLRGHTHTVAYLTHIYSWVIPMAMGDCHAALGSYGTAEREYLRTREYEYLNKVVESVTLWTRLAELYVEWGDSRYRRARNDVSRYDRARELYERVVRLDGTIDPESPLYDHVVLSDVRARTEAVLPTLFDDDADPVSIEENPRLLIAFLRARQRLTQIDAGLNFLGYGVHFPPFSFEHLQNLARYFAQHASRVEGSYIQFKSRAEDEEFRESQLAQQAEIARASVELEERGLDEAREGVDVAEETFDYATVQRNNAREARTEFADVRWELLELEQAQAWASASAVDRDDQVRLSWSGHHYSSSRKRRNVVLKELAYQRSRITHDMEASRLQREVESADAYRDVARQQVEQAEARQRVAEQRVAVAELQQRYAEENRDFLDGREFSSRMWYDLSREARRLSRRSLDAAIEVATLMEKAYEAETGRDLRLIKFDYGREELNGLLGAEALLADIDQFSLDHVRTKAKKAQLKQTFSLADRFPMAFSRLQETGRAFFETRLEDFDRAYPGLYLQKIKNVEVVFVGLTGPEGVHGTLRNIGVSQFRHEDGRIENMVYPADVMPLSEYDVRRDAIVFQLDSSELRLFENSGVATMWQLDLPRASNTFDPSSVLDIHLVVSYDAFFSAALETEIRESLPATGSASRGISLGLYVPDELYYLRSQGTAEIPFEEGMFPANQTDRVRTDLTMRATGDPGTVGGLTLSVHSAALDETVAVTLDADGRADASAFGPFVGQDLLDTWTVTVAPEDNPDLVTDGELDLSGVADLSVFVEYDFAYPE
ncbi:Tc toxin subunit A-related protein [Salinigranum salinum]|uniref:Tc toxin subunit A-related protein n=1 Tax=Salinigranum salinum TaxID=1364937 RepID=UPI0012612E21|nr:hypothetical protein [Salinigranum salinum]